MEAIPNVLAGRYASAAMQEIWSPRGKVVLEREFWIAVMKAQRELGLPIPAEAIAAYERVKDTVDLAAIDARERVTRHDVKARIEEFCGLAGHEHVHKGMTSRDLTENVEQLQLFRSLELIRVKAVAALAGIARQASAHRDLVFTARTHNVAAQPTTMGKRLAMFGEELLLAVQALEDFLERYPARGLKGAVGTQLDLLTLLDDDAPAVAGLEEGIARHLGLPVTLGAVGQVYPRSLDFAAVSLLVQLSSGPANFCRTLRLMAGHELASEGFAAGQVGSSAMPHKMNARSCERVNGFCTVLKGHAAMAAGLVGDQWNEGDVSCSVVRRVLLPDACFALDGLFETFLTILKQMEVYPEVVARENRQYFPFLLTTTILMAAVKQGAGRETAHEAIKEHAVRVAKDLRSGRVEKNDLLDRLAADTRLGLSRAELDRLLAGGLRLVGRAQAQVDAFAAAAAAWVEKVPAARTCQPGEIL